MAARRSEFEDPAEIEPPASGRDGLVRENDPLWLPTYALPLLPALVELSEHLGAAVTELAEIYEQTPNPKDQSFAQEICRGSLKPELQDLSDAVFHLVVAHSPKFRRHAPTSELFSTAVQDGMLRFSVTPDQTGSPVRAPEWRSLKTISRLVGAIGVPGETHEKGWPGVLHVANNFAELKSCVAALTQGLANNPERQNDLDGCSGAGGLLEVAGADRPKRKRKTKGPGLNARLLVVSVLQTHHCRKSGEINQDVLGTRTIAERANNLVSASTAGRHRNAIFRDGAGYEKACRDRTVCARLATAGELQEKVDKAKTRSPDELDQLPGRD
jgi:hypothetical protein